MLWGYGGEGVLTYGNIAPRALAALARRAPGCGVERMLSHTDSNLLRATTEVCAAVQPALSFSLGIVCPVEHRTRSNETEHK